VLAVGSGSVGGEVEVVFASKYACLHFETKSEATHAGDKGVNRVLLLLYLFAVGRDCVESLDNLLFDLLNASSLYPGLFHVFHIY